MQDISMYFVSTSLTFYWFVGLKMRWQLARMSYRFFIGFSKRLPISDLRCSVQLERKLGTT